MKLRFTPQFFYGVGIGLILWSIVGSTLNAYAFYKGYVTLEQSVNLLFVAFIILIAGGVFCATSQN